LGVIEHDIHHGRGISTTLGVHGLPVVDMDRAVGSPEPWTR